MNTVTNFFTKYNYILFDSKKRVNAMLKRSKIFPEIEKELLILTSNLPQSATIAERIILLKHNITDWPKCEVCNNFVKFSVTTLSFTPFCCFKCSRTKGSSTFEKAKQTCLAKYGVESNLALPQNIINIKNKYGGIGLGSASIKEKIEQTNIEKYGVENVFGANSIKEKIIQTNNIKYGGHHQTVKMGNKLKLLEDKEYCINLSKQFSLNGVAEAIGVSTSTISKYFELHNITTFNRQKSKPEYEIIEFIKSFYTGEIIYGDRKLLKPYEIDIYIPEFKIGIEVNGVYWHSENNGITRNYHLNKLNKALAININLIQIFENEWYLKQDIVKSKIRALLQQNKKIFARKCIIAEVSNKEKKQFLIQNHLQGDCSSKINLGLYHNEKLVSIMTFSKCRFSKEADFELLRFCNINDINVIGGFSKLLSYFQKFNNYPSILSFADRRYSIGNVYNKNGFKFVSNSKPNYFYFKNSTFLLENRIQYQKHKLIKKLKIFDTELSEWDNMKNNNFNRIWDCGSSKWILE